MAAPKLELRIVSDLKEIAPIAAQEFDRAAKEAIQAKGFFAVAISGGSTPRGLYSLLADKPIPWDRAHFFWADERHVPPDHPDSNYRMAHELLLSHVPVLAGQVHRIPAEEADAAKAAERYEADLRRFFQLAPGQVPRFDLILLGMGEDGHVASLFPKTDLLDERKRLVAAPWVEKLNAHRITVTPRVINHASSIVILVSGEKKAETLQAVLEGGYEPELLPAQSICPAEGTLLWLVDKAAACRLSRVI